ncbi:hypothetical protein Q5H92_10615 [Hymenobacter sp. M29]|uniref:Uncharacterized protein n=1 Tax=Hymenobacter mellowenesis TaxID=3063995 RepID=A0ABT9AAE7_9BACT|nr:hypothetical protein [Hymenobacter sp. M29]MDO7846810.1 hypothetical protein [Hymenobacter sp. M29]
MQYDQPVDVLTNVDYILFDNKYERVLRQLGDQVQLRAATVADGVRKLV